MDKRVVPMNQYTKGEWETFDFRSNTQLYAMGHFQVVGNNQESNVALVPAHWENAEANAHLIAAAPDMYEALKTLLQDYSTNPNSEIFFKACLNARRALEKAEGK